MKQWKRAWVALVLIVLNGMSTAGGTDTCTADITRAFSRTQLTCATLERGYACYGAGRASVTTFNGANPPRFEQPGDIVSLNDIETLTVSSPTSVVFLRLAAGVDPVSERSHHVLLFGDATLTNHVTPVPIITVMVQSLVNIRTAPEANSEVLGRAAINTSLRANGRSADSRWLRVLIPNTAQHGWVSRDLVTTADDVDILAADVLESAVHPAFAEFTLATDMDRTSSDAGCASALPSGLLLQTPNLEDETLLTFNGTAMRVAGAVFLQSNVETTIDVLEGRAEVDATVIPAGTRVVIGENSNPVPYQLTQGDFIPVLYLERAVVLPPPLSQADILSSSLPPTPQALPAVTQTTCGYVMRRSETTRSGPGNSYGAITTLNQGAVVIPISQVATAAGNWVRIRPYGWLPAAAVAAQGDCPPLVEEPYRVEPRFNALSIERCAPENGPLRRGQHVELGFIPDPFINYPTALAATRNNPGRITVNGIALTTYATSPIRLDEHSFIRRFWAEWRAEAGTVEIVGTHAAYTIACTITVSPGN